jgi:hypothetical protein
MLRYCGAFTKGYRLDLGHMASWFGGGARIPALSRKCIQLCSDGHQTKIVRLRMASFLPLGSAE